MEKENILLLIFSFFLLKPVASANDTCLPATCGPNEPEVRFPFYIVGRQPDSCGYPGYELSCDEQNKTILRLSSSLSYIVNGISYTQQVIYIDPDFCRPNRIASVNITDTPFDYYLFLERSYTFYNCSLQSSFLYDSVPFPCLSTGNYSVIAIRNTIFSPDIPSNCKVMKEIVVPFPWNSDFRDELELIWYAPYCKSCDSQVTAAFGSIIGIIAFICISIFVCNRPSRPEVHNDTSNQVHSDSSSQSTDTLSIMIDPQPPLRTGLDVLTIESYPKSLLGESFRLPSDDGTCSICLSDYKPKDLLRTILECNHYFHSECIDEWLKMNATCPLCRNRPKS